jgi:hypothetical protein
MIKRHWLKDYAWEDVVALNVALCETGHAQHGRTSDGYDKTKAIWDQKHPAATSFLEAVELCREAHKLQPFLNFNGNLFASIARQVARVYGLSMDPEKATILRSTVGHYVAGVTDRKAVEQILNAAKNQVDKPRIRL